MKLTENIIVRYKDLTFKFKKGSRVIKEKDGSTYIVPGEKKNKTKKTEDKPVETNGGRIIHEVIT